MNQNDKRQVENQLMAMGLPALDDPALFQVMADLVNGYPIPSERVEFFCELLNQCEGQNRTDCYNALRPRLHFEVPTLAECETRITAKAERIVGRRLRADGPKPAEPEDRVLHLKCFACGKQAPFVDLSVAGAMLGARKAGWGRGPVRFQEYCPECRLAAANGSMGGSLTRSTPIEGKVH